MSSTVRFTPLQPLESEDETYVYTSRNAHGAGVKILDYEGLTDAIRDVFVESMDTREVTEKDEYPHKTWKKLLGFTTFGGEDEDVGSPADYHNLSNMSLQQMCGLWENVSEYTEPFVVYQTTFEGAWPEAAELDSDRENTVYRIEAADGEVDVVELTLGVVEEQPVDF